MPRTATSPLSPGPGLGGGGFGATVAKVPLTDREIRLKCAELAVALKPPTASVVSLANDLYKFVTG